MALNVKQKVIRLRRNVAASCSVFYYSIQLRETLWPAAYDRELHQRMSHCLAGNAFEIIRIALRRELILSLAKLWDRDDDLIRLDRVACYLKTSSVITEIAEQNMQRFPLLPGIEEVRAEAERKSLEAIEILDKYGEKGTHRHLHDKLRDIRNTELAHHRLVRDANIEVQIPHSDIEECFSDMAKLIHFLLCIVDNSFFDLDEAGKISRMYAEKFWNGVVSETDERHPNFKRPFQPQSP